MTSRREVSHHRWLDHQVYRGRIPVVPSDTLISLRVADPQNANSERWLPDEVYDNAFDEWEAARDSAYTAWKELTDPNAFQPDLPLSFRDAYSLVRREGGYLGRENRRLPSPTDSRRVAVCAGPRAYF